MYSMSLSKIFEKETPPQKFTSGNMTSWEFQDLHVKLNMLKIIDFPDSAGCWCKNDSSKFGIRHPTFYERLKFLF